MFIGIVVVVVALAAAAQWMRHIEGRVDRLNARIGELEQEIRDLRGQGGRW